MIMPEIVEVGIYNSLVVAKNIRASKERRTTTFEIELPIEEGGVSYIDSSSKHIKTNMIICAKPGQVRHTRFPFKCYYVHVNVEDSGLYDTLMKIPVFFETDKAEVYRDIFEKLFKYYNSFDENEDIILQSLLLELVYVIVKDPKIKNMSSENNRTVERAIEYIEEHLTEELTLESVAKQMSFSPIHFHNTFKKATGKTLRDYIEEQRIKKATTLLLSTNYSLTQIAYECGFSSQSYFSYVFKRRMKRTPREYAKEIHRRYEI